MMNHNNHQFHPIFLEPYSHGCHWQACSWPLSNTIDNQSLRLHQCMHDLKFSMKLGFKNIVFMNEFWIIRVVNMMYTRSQNYTNVMLGEHVIQLL